MSPSWRRVMRRKSSNRVDCACVSPPHAQARQGGWVFSFFFSLTIFTHNDTPIPSPALFTQQQHLHTIFLTPPPSPISHTHQQTTTHQPYKSRQDRDPPHTPPPLRNHKPPTPHSRQDRDPSHTPPPLRNHKPPTPHSRQDRDPSGLAMGARPLLPPLDAHHPGLRLRLLPPLEARAHPRLW